MTPWGLLIVVLLLAALLTDPARWMPWLLSLTLALPKTAALIAGPFPLGGFQLVSLACAPLLLHHLSGAAAEHQDGAGDRIHLRLHEDLGRRLEQRAQGLDELRCDPTVDDAVIE